MAFEIMGGHTGKAHVTSDDVAVFNEALYGGTWVERPSVGAFLYERTA